MLHEYRDVLARERFGFTASEVDAVLQHLRAVGELVNAPPLTVTLPDPDDLPFPEVAAAGGARAHVTGNAADFDPREGSHSVTVVAPDSFLDAVEGD